MFEGGARIHLRLEGVGRKRGGSRREGPGGLLDELNWEVHEPGGDVVSGLADRLAVLVGLGGDVGRVNQTPLLFGLLLSGELRPRRATEDIREHRERRSRGEGIFKFRKRPADGLVDALPALRVDDEGRLARRILAAAAEGLLEQGQHQR